ncbi:uncharacterized protein PF11_0207-like [Thunnus maccoyii]|uniref:uncharacterized protein PF11_0207-like n=1 Tax=Thunnus maccoyii TaxID=8240 RepID=UPI001C4DAE4D|nr:uncharacterized protein PF11_0207-like [Thunnus maccoyii]
MSTRISEREWKTALTSILEELDESEYNKMLLSLHKIPKRAKTGRSKEEMPQIIIQHYGVNDSIFAIKEAMERIPRRDSAVQDLLCPFVDKLNKVLENSADVSTELETEAQTLIEHQRPVCSIANTQMCVEKKDMSEGTLVKVQSDVVQTRRHNRTDKSKWGRDSPGMQNQKINGCQQASIYSAEKKEISKQKEEKKQKREQETDKLKNIIRELKEERERETDELKNIIRELKEERERETDELKNIIRELKEERERETDELKNIIRELKEERDKCVSELTKRIDAAESRIAEQEEREIAVTKMLHHTLCQKTQLEERCENLEKHYRANNLRIHSVPEKCEGNNIVGFVETLIRENLDVKGEIHIERAHRVNRQKKNDIRPRSIMVRFQNYSVTERVLQAAWAKKDIRVNDSRIYFNSDFTTKVFKVHAQYRKVRKQLKDKNIKSRIISRARLRIFEKNGNIKVFDNPQAAAEGLREFGINMEIPAGELDLESQLQAASSRK